MGLVHKSVFLLIVVVLLGSLIFLSPPQTKSAPQVLGTSTILSECMSSENAPVHHHVTLKLSYLGNPMPLPDNIGVEEGCMHPLDTHDGRSNQIHIHYTREYPFTVGDFFHVWGVIFNKNQLGNNMASERRQIRMKVNGQANTEFENYVMKNGDVIEIAVTKGSSR